MPRTRILKVYDKDEIAKLIQRTLPVGQEIKFICLKNSPDGKFSVEVEL